jgi:phosphoglycolate phosphatase
LTTQFCIFDLDGTLVNSLEDLADATNYALRLQGFPTHPVDQYRRFVGDGVVMLLQRAAPQPCSSEELKRLHSDFDQYYSVHCFDKTRPYEGCEALLHSLSQNQIPFGVLSNKPHQFVGEIVRRLFPNAAFASVAGKRPGYEKKPDPAALNEMIRIQGAEKKRCLYIGDSDVDVYTAHNAGIRCCGALWGFRGYQELSLAGADYFAAAPLDVRACL